jgi:hypothetical protein
MNVRRHSMETITHSEVEELIKRLPGEKLPAAYEAIRELLHAEDNATPQSDFMRLPLSERRQILAEQAEQLTLYNFAASMSSDSSKD